MASENSVVLIPVYNDWECVRTVLSQIDLELERAGLTAHVMLVDDGSTTAGPAGLDEREWRSVSQVEVLRLHRNLGHQRAIAVGLTQLQARGQYSAIAVMDGDGEDRPSDLPLLIRTLREDDTTSAVFAARRRRAEGPLFKAFYALYRWTHWLLTGRPVRVGNFGVVSAAVVERLVRGSELWNHFAAAATTCGLPWRSIPVSRGSRLAGRSHMNLTRLVVHGLSAMAVHVETIGARLLLASVAAIALTLAGLVGVVAALRVGTEMVLPGWTAMVAGLLLVVLMQVLTLSVAFAFLSLAWRQNYAFLPIRDCAVYVRSVDRLFPR